MNLYSVPLYCIVLQLLGDAGRGGHVRQDGAAPGAGGAPRGHPAAARGLRGGHGEDRGAPARWGQVRGGQPNRAPEPRVHPA